MFALVCVAGAVTAIGMLPPVHRLHSGTDPSIPRARADPVVSAASRAADVRLCASCLQAGMSQAAAAAAVAEACASSDSSTWAHTAALLRLGCDARGAWAPLAAVEGLADVASLAELSSRGGASITEGLERYAHTLMDSAQAEATARAERAGVLIAAPLTLCFLPAFIVLGLAPIVIDVASRMSAGL